MDFSTIWTVTYNVILVIIGINALIIVHEFGHFAVARLCGVRCDKFYIWFDFWGLKFFKFKWGQTEYGLGLFPLGGYVKMLGQEDNPGELRKEIERAKQQAQESGSAADNVTPAALQEAVFAPDSYLAKSVPQRLAIIVAGVTMNFLFAIVCAAAAYHIGFTATAPAVGSVTPGSSAWEAGLQVGDKITSINGAPARVFTDVNMAMVGSENGVNLAIDRNALPLEINLIPRKRKSDLAPMIGVGALPTLDLAVPEKEPVLPLAKKYYAPQVIESLKKKNVRIEKVEGQSVNNYAEYLDAVMRHFDKPVKIEFRGVEGTKEIPAIPMKEIKDKDTDKAVRFRMGSITSVLPGSDAQKKGIKPGDTIISVDGIPAGGDTGFDPLKLPQILLRKVNAEQKSVKLTLAKSGTSNEEPVTLDVELQPVRILPSLNAASIRDPVGSTALGLAWNVEAVLDTGERVTGVEFRHSIALFRKKTSFAEKTPDGFMLSGIGSKIDIPYIFTVLLQSARVEEKEEQGSGSEPAKGEVSVRLTLEDKDGSTRTEDFPISDATDWFNTDRGFILADQKSVVKVNNFGEACWLGTQKMIDSSLAVYKFLKALFSGGVSPYALGGPVLIVEAAYDVVSSGLGPYLMFLCLIGANLAVVNILPMPPLDGGHVVFLLYEGIFRRQPNELIQVILSYAGLFLILLLMVWVVSLDLSCIPRW
ncbi:MAG: site-2 protease family protein [Planctomycetaceae bacterium]|jgi:regulator of sigma E protease|nr:site-2 protease family protein [Planctomycetaceae bacterium]